MARRDKEPPNGHERSERSMEWLGKLRRRNKAIARHDRKELRAVWRPSSIHDAGDVAEVLRTDIRC